jgi:hypothetical protein
VACLCINVRLHYHVANDSHPIVGDGGSGSGSGSGSGIAIAPPGQYGPSSVHDIGIVRAAASRNAAAGGGVGGDGGRLGEDGRIVGSGYSDGGNEDGEDAPLCRLISSALDPAARLPDVIYHKDRLPRPPLPRDDPAGAQYDRRKFSSVEEDDVQARRTIREFNKLRREIMTPKMLDLGVSTGGRRRVRASRAFAGRLRTLLGVEGGGGGVPADNWARIKRRRNVR